MTVEDRAAVYIDPGLHRELAHARADGDGTIRGQVEAAVAEHLARRAVGFDSAVHERMLRAAERARLWRLIRERMREAVISLPLLQLADDEQVGDSWAEAQRIADAVCDALDMTGFWNPLP